MNEQEVLLILSKVGAVITDGHFVYTSGKHGGEYVNKDALYPHTAETSIVCRALAKQFVSSEVDAVIAPAIGGVILAQWVAHHLGEMSGKEVLAVYAERPVAKHGFIIKRGYDKLIFNKNVLVVEDILTTGGSARNVVEVTRKACGKVVGLGALCNRGGITSRDVANVPKLVSLVHLKLDAWEPETCRLCEWSIPVNIDVGKGREFVHKQLCGGVKR